MLVVVVTAVVVAKLLLRRRAPDPGWFIDSTRAAGALTVIGTMFAVLLAFTIFYSLQNYQRARDGGSMERLRSRSCTTWPTSSKDTRAIACTAT